MSVSIAPKYQGVYEAQFLSQAIHNMMECLELINKHLEEMVGRRTRELAQAKKEAGSATRAKLWIAVIRGKGKVEDRR